MYNHRHHHHHHQCSAQKHCKRRNLGCSSAEGRSSTGNSGTKAAVLGFNRCGSFPLLSAPYSLFSIWTDFKRSEKIPGATTKRWGECIWLTGPSGLHRNSPQGLNISSIGFLTRSEIRKSQTPFAPISLIYGAKGDWDLWISDLVKNPDESDI